MAHTSNGQTPKTQTPNGQSAKAPTPKGQTTKERTPNDQRSDRYNDTSKEYKDAMDNRSTQLDPKNDNFQGPQPADKAK